MSKIRPTIEEGFRVGMLTVEQRTAEKKNRYSVWLCRCDCGGEIKLDTRCLQRGTVKDCGCATKVKPGTTDISGMRFGKLVALEQTDERKNSGSAVWICKCDCGNSCKASITYLEEGLKYIETQMIDKQPNLIVESSDSSIKNVKISFSSLLDRK